MEFVKYHVFPQGYMMRVSPENGREQVRVSKQAVKRGIPTLTSIDTALAAVSLLDDGWTEDATGLVDVSRISSGRQL